MVIYKCLIMNTNGGNKLLQFEGLRGFAALIVFFSHIKNTFFPSYSEPLMLYLKTLTNNKYLAIIFHSFIEILFNGFVAVDIFWIMSAYVLTMGFFKMDIDKLIKQLKSSISKRYFRLMIPVAVSVLFSYAFMKFNLFYNIELIKQNIKYDNVWLSAQFSYSPNFIQILKTIFWNTFFNYNAQVSYNSSLWTMSPEFFGSMLCFCSIVITRNNNRRYLFYIVIILISIFYQNRWLLAFTLGVLLSDFNYTKHNDYSIALKLKNLENTFFKLDWIPVVLVLIIIVLIGLGDFYGIAYLFESFLIVYLTLNSKYLTYLFSTKPLVFLGKISFSLYLIHIIIICSLTCYLYIYLPIHSEVIRIIVSTLVSMCVLIVLSNIYTIYIDTIALKFSSKVGKYFSA